MIKFGTDGWRAILDQDFNDENVKKATLAIGKYVCDTYGLDKKIIIGYDPRRKADYYAKFCAEILAERGFEVLLSNRIIPTPILAFNAKHLNACAIMFTASHNPADYLGMKFIPDYAGPATSDITDKIMANLGLDPQVHPNGSYKEVDFMPAYYEHLKTIVDFEVLKTIKTNIIFDGLYSASIGYFDKILNDYNISFKSLHMKHDVNFGGGMPDPKVKYLNDLIKMVKDSPNSIGLANDGDADRFGVINEDGCYVSPDIIIAILLKYLLSKGYKGAVVKTVGSSILIDNVAKKLGVDVIETAVGFKHVGEAMRNNKVIIGGEESGGLSILGHIPEKDGIIANLLILEVMAKTGKSLVELQKEILDLGGRYYTDRVDLKKSNPEEIKQLINIFKNIDKIGEFEIIQKDLKDGVKLLLDENTKILVRPSGTEPLLRIYFEALTKERIYSLESAVEQITESAGQN